jgi:predicted nucleotidyltransferase
MEEAMRHLNEAKKYSDEKLKALKDDFRTYSNAPVCAITVGSFARREATRQSDLDYFVITDDKECGREVLAQFPKFLKRHDIRSPSAGGAFGGITQQDDLIKNVGGRDDDNDSLTKRLLFLMESECLVGDDMYGEIQDKLISVYVKDSITEHQIARFLLNDLIRYYRTICVDFEYKTCELNKSWGDRNLKLMFSRKLMFFSGLLTVAQTAQSTGVHKKAVLKHFFNRTPIDRVREICEGRADAALRLYSEFIGCIGDEETRRVLNETEMDRKTHTEEFRTHKNTGHHFTWALSKLLTDTFDEAHPIHLALKF